MKYLCLGYLDPQAMDAKAPSEIDALMSRCGPYLDTLYQTQAVVVDAGLAPETKTLRRSAGRVIVTDGPFAETKELLGSVFILEADTFEEAVRLASLHPTVQIDEGASLGWRLELRPVLYWKG